MKKPDNLQLQVKEKNNGKFRDERKNNTNRTAKHSHINENESETDEHEQELFDNVQKLFD